MNEALNVDAQRKYAARVVSKCDSEVLQFCITHCAMSDHSLVAATWWTQMDKPDLRLDAKHPRLTQTSHKKHRV